MHFPAEVIVRVLLLSANTSLEPHPVYPLGLDYVAGAISSSHKVRILDANLLDGEEGLRADIQAFAPNAVGISLRNIDSGTDLATKSFIERARRLVKTVRSCCDASVILGGSGFSLYPFPLLEYLEADCGIVGEGERLADLLSALESGNPKPVLPGIVLRGQPPRHPAPWPGQPSRRLPGENLHTSFYLGNGGILNLQTKRGCLFRCIYCVYPLLEGENLRLFPPEEVGRTARSLQDSGARYLYVTDSVFNAHEEHSLAVAGSLRDAGISVPWGGFFTPRVSRPDYFSRMAECGLTHVEFGTESLSGHMLRTYGKPFGPEDVFDAHRKAQEAGLFVSHYFLLGGPGETGKTVMETLKRIEKLPRSVFFFSCGIRMHPETRIHSMALREGSIAPNEDLMQPVFYTPRGISLAGINEMLETFAGGRGNWVIPRNEERLARVTRRLYAMGHTGVLWDRLIG